MITDRTLSLIQSLLHTHSPSKQLDLIKDYCLYEADMSQQSHQVESLLLTCREIIQDKRQQGVQAAKKKVKKLGPHKRPKFFDDFKGKGNCEKCKATIDGSKTPVPAFFHRLGKSSSDVRLYCPMPSCFPAEHKENMKEDKDYIRTMLKSK